MIRVLLADDDPQYLKTLRTFIVGQLDMQLVDCATDGDAAVLLERELRPDVTVLDVLMPGTDGVSATRMIRENDPDACVVLMTAHEDPVLRNLGLSAGASDFLSKREVPTRLLPAIRAAADGRAQPSVP